LRDRIRTSITTAVVLALAWTMLAIAPASAAGEKVVIIVGPTGSQTAGYRSTGDSIAATAQAAGATVVKVYSPNATWANVRAAVNGANIIVYLGHGNGYPNPYSATENTDRVNGWGVNKVAGGGGGGDDESNMIYCGEQALLGTLSSSNSRYPYCAGGITPAPGFVMIYNKACYTPGAGETADANESMAFERVRHFSYPALQLGGSAYFATDLHQGAQYLVDTILRNPSMTYGDIARGAPGYDAVAQRHNGHPDLAGRQVWIQQTYAMGRMDYWYAYAGNPNASFANPGAPATPSRLAVARLAGADRYATAAAVSSASFAPGVPVAYVATGANFPDALAGSAAAAVRGGPMLLVSSAGVPAATASELSRLRPGQIVVLGGGAVVSEATLQSLVPYATSGVVRRLAGGNRFETAAAISADTFAPGVPIAYVATGSNFPDALAGTPAAGAQGGPVLLTGKTELPAATAAELARLHPGRIVILGGGGVVSDGVASQLQAYTSGGVTRMAGGDRYATAVSVTSATYPSADVVYVATGANFPDALAGGPVAGRDGRPLLLVPATGLPDVVRAELLRLNPSSVIILGSTGVVSDAIVGQLQALFPG
jgi:putative cell wall-binding protein